MYTKISHGTNFMGAALYDAEGLSKEQKKQKTNKVELLQTKNLLSDDARSIALEMQKVASYSRSQKPVWNIAMSAPEGVKLTADQWQQAAVQNLMAMGVEPDRHQYAIYRHSDTNQDHIHILLNSVPVDGGPAVSRQFKAAKAKLAAPQIDQALGILSQKGESIQDQLSSRISYVLKEGVTNEDELSNYLDCVGVRVNYSRRLDNSVFGATFQLVDKDHKPVKGSKLRIDGKDASWNTIKARLDANRGAYEAEIAWLKEQMAEAEKARELAEKARKQAEQERDQAENKPVTIKEVVVVKEVPDPADKAEIDRLINELNKANKKADRFKSLGTTILDENDKLRQVNEELTRKLQTKEVNYRVNEFYAVVGDNGLSIDSGRVESYLRKQKSNGALGLISTFLAQDFPNPATAAIDIEKKINTDYERGDNSVYIPKDFMSAWWNRPKNERLMKFATTAESNEWRNICNSSTLTPTQQDLVKSLQKMRFGTSDGGEKEDKRRQVKY